MNSMPQSHIPEARILVIMTGGTICMQKSPDGLVPARNFLDRCMAPRPEFNDGEAHDPLDVALDDGPDGLGKLQSLRTPTSVYGKRVRYFIQALSPPLMPTSILPFHLRAEGRSNPAV